MADEITVNAYGCKVVIDDWSIDLALDLAMPMKLKSVKTIRVPFIKFFIDIRLKRHSHWGRWGEIMRFHQMPWAEMKF